MVLGLAGCMEDEGYEGYEGYEADYSEEQYESSEETEDEEYYSESETTYSDSEYGYPYDNHLGTAKELEGKIDKLKNDIEKRIDEIKSAKRWLIGLIISIFVAIAGYFIFPYQIAKENQKDISTIRTIIDENIKPSINRNSHAIEKNTEEISNNTDNIHQLQNQQSKKRSTQ